MRQAPPSSPLKAYVRMLSTVLVFLFTPVMAFGCTIVPRSYDVGSDFTISVKDSFGSPVSGVVVVVEGQNGKRVVKTNGIGQAAFQSLSSGQYAVTVGASLSAYFEVRVESHLKPAKVLEALWPHQNLIEARSLSGTLYSSSGKLSGLGMVPGLSIELVRASSGKVVGRKKISEKGEFHFSEKRSGIYLLQFSAPDSETRAVAVRLNPLAASQQLQIEAAVTSCGLSAGPLCDRGRVRLQALNGSVADSSGAVITRAAVRVKNQSGTTVAETTTDEVGEFRIPGVSSGNYILEIGSSGFARWMSGLEIDPSITNSRRPTFTLQVIGNECTTAPQNGILR